jgi:phosphoribosyl-ATP pyrophosphohydrolase/phosphoribosyl-AMP cyclohydrolase
MPLLVAAKGYAMKSQFDSGAVDWKKSSDGLVPAIIQDVISLRVLMLGYMNRESLDATVKSGLVTFYSRSKQRLWQKGETSGHVLRVKDIKLDCDQDTLLILAEPQGPTCHVGTKTCFGDSDEGLAVLADLAVTIRERHKNPKDGSYTAKLFKEGIPRIAQKVGEEGVEVALAASSGGDKLANEAADLVYHLSVLLEAAGMDWNDVMKVLAQRAKGKS